MIRHNFTLTHEVLEKLKEKVLKSNTEQIKKQQLKKEAENILVEDAIIDNQ